MTYTAYVDRPQKVSFAIYIIVASTFLMAAQDAVVKLVSADLPLWQLFAVRSMIAIPLLILLVFLSGKQAAVSPLRPGWAFVRGGLLVGMYVAFYAGLPVLDLSVVAAAYYTGPLFITLFAALFLGEHVGKRGVLALVMGFVGVMVILRPGTSSFSYMMLIPIISAVFYAFAAILARSKCGEDSPVALSLALNFSFIFCGLGATAGIALWQPEAVVREAYPFLLGEWVDIGPREWLVVAGLALANVGIHLGLAKAYQSAPPPVIATFDYSYLIFAVIWGYVLFVEIPDVPTLLGMVLITVAGLLAVLKKRPSLRAR